MKSKKEEIKDIEFEDEQENELYNSTDWIEIFEYPFAAFEPTNSTLNLPGVITNTAKKKFRAHNEAISIITHLLDACGFEVNYDHIVTNIEKDKSIPLVYIREHKKHRADIAFRISHDRIAFIEIYTRDINDLKKLNKEGEDHGKDQE